jgi:hypothetical protein
MLKAILHGTFAVVLAGFSVAAAIAVEPWSWHFWGFLGLGCLALTGVLAQTIGGRRSARV